MDLIDRQEAINAFCKGDCACKYCGVPCGGVMEVEKLPSAQQWIPCSERLPENDNPVIVTMNWLGEKIITSTACWDGCWRDEYDDGYDVIAWMPLPAPYDPLHGAMNPPEDDITDGKGEAK